MRTFVSGMSRAGILRHYIEMDRHKDGAQMEADLRGATEFTNRSDYSVALMYLGRGKEAVVLLEHLEKEQPGHYYIAANLGTAYELSGNNAEAIRWIQEGIRRNRSSHDDSEWLHVKILEAKIQQEKDADYFKKHSVLDLNPERIKNGITFEGRNISTEELGKAIESQLMERTQFVKPPDPAVASLLFDYAAIDATRNSLESAKKVLQLAIKYGYPPENVQPLMTDFDRRIFWATILQYVLFALVLAAIVWGLRVLYKCGIFAISGRAVKRKG
jgi:tetratricopeptide (TPR) repeat protein